MLKWERKNKKKDEKNGEKEKPPERDDLEAIGLSPSKSSSNISIHSENGTYISHASISEIKKTYGTIQEYLKQRYGPGKYTITVKGKSGEDTQHISIASEESPLDRLSENPLPGMDDNRLMGIYFAQQAENARLKAELDAIKNSSQQSMLGQIVPTVMDFIKTMMQSRPDTDLASVMTAATESLRTLSEIRMPGEKSDDVGGLMGGIAQLVQGFQQKQAQPTNPPVYIQAPPLYPSPPVNIIAQPTVPNPMPQAPLTPPPINVVAPPLSPTPMNPPIGATNSEFTNNRSGLTDNTDVFFGNLIGMAEQRQSPKVIADYIIQGIQKIPPQEIQKLDPQMQVLVGQLQINPVAAFDAICLYEPSLAADGKYTAEIKAELQKIVQG